MDHEIQFGEVEETPPRRELRPDRNRHFAVVACGEPADGELPVFVDLDVLREMESHAQSDTSVELGGVMLGGQYTDEDGRPFVVVTDSLRARHFEATRGSFKFTHDTWSEITRQRDGFPGLTQMVGWYHTHPDWGVFLSGMDMFICDNFFNRPLDVALVIDPCRGDRGWFQWTGDSRERVRRTRGFYLTASRFRQTELEQYAAQLEGNVMAPIPQGSHPGYSAPVVNIAGDRSPYQGPAVLGLLVIQFCFLMIVAWKMLAAPAAPAESKAEQLAAVEERIDRWIREEREVIRGKAQTDLLDRVVAQLGKGPEGTIHELAATHEESERLTSEVRGQRALVHELERTNQELAAAAKERQQQLVEKVDELARSQEKLRSRYDVQAEQLAKLVEERDTLKKQLANGDDTDQARTPWYRNRWYAGIGGGVAAMACFAWFVLRNKPLDERREDKEEPAAANNEAGSSDS